MNHKIQLLIFFVGLMIIGGLFYFINFTYHEKRENNKTIEKIQKNDLKTIVTNEDVPVRKDMNVLKQKAEAKKDIPEYKEVFKEKPAPQSAVERMTQEEKTLFSLKQ